MSKPDTQSSEIIGLAAAILVLLFTFGTAVAMALPITTAILGLVCGLSIVTLLSHVAEVPTVAPTLATMIGLGVGIDYALFIVTRHRAQRRGRHGHAGVDRALARPRAAPSSSPAHGDRRAAVAGVVNIPLVTTLGYTSALVVAVAVCGAITLLPALLGVGDRIDRLPRPSPTTSGRRPSARLAALGPRLAARPWPCLVGAVVILGSSPCPCST